jgi:hypothetical protein
LVLNFVYTLWLDHLNLCPSPLNIILFFQYILFINNLKAYSPVGPWVLWSNSDVL